MAAKRPNILHIFTDMQRADTIHALGNPHIKTPHLDRLVREGTAFTNCVSPSPVCVPARCCMHYGWYPTKTGLYTNGRMMEDNGRSIPAVLSEEGYRTQSVGKCHFTPDKHAKRGYDVRLVQEEGCSNPEADDYVRYLRDNGYDYYEPQGARGEMYYIPQISSLPVKAHPSQWVADRCIDFIRDAGAGDKPWMLFSSFIHPHPPFAPPKPWHKLYRSFNMPLPHVPAFSETLHTWINRQQNRYKYRDQGIDNQLLRLIKAYYYATISFVDFQVGRMLKTLEHAGQLDNTLIMFTSDHGEYLGDFNCFGKRSMHNPSSRVPMLVRYPERFAQNVRCDEPVNLVDVFPTFMASASIGTHGLDLDGLDMSEVARGNGAREHVFSQFSQGPTGITMAVSREWKYFYSAGDRHEFLFDRIRDPQESVNEADNPLRREVKTYIKTALLEFLHSHNQDDAIVATEQGLDWKQYETWDDSKLRNPNAGLLIQDHPSYPLELEGYTD